MTPDPECLFMKGNKVHAVNSYMVICIPKNASTWLQKNLGTAVPSTKPSNINKVCVLRDPIERWASGVAEYISSTPGSERNERLVLKFFRNARETVLSNGVKAKVGFNGAEGLDVHTKPQNRFVSKAGDRTTWFYLDEQFTENFFTWASAKKITIPYKHEKKINVTEKNTIKSDLAKHYLKLVSQDDFLQSKVKYFYQEDYDLIERVEFYGK